MLLGAESAGALPGAVPGAVLGAVLGARAGDRTPFTALRQDFTQGCHQTLMNVGIWGF